MWTVQHCSCPRRRGARCEGKIPPVDQGAHPGIVIEHSRIQSRPNFMSSTLDEGKSLYFNANVSNLTSFCKLFCKRIFQTSIKIKNVKKFKKNSDKGIRRTQVQFRSNAERGMIFIFVNFEMFTQVDVYFVYSVFVVRMQFICTNMSLVCRFDKTY